ncbi:N-acetylmuramic acid 6-phosphate etherase [Paenibacillus sp. GCM10023252]|uniref:N-acetylmuramic acid 6-phosphate etherase n=1 Tax=Paenibacillus sp. GCM10023252 TaxID=3252649 RepID=UPI0036226642
MSDSLSRLTTEESSSHHMELDLMSVREIIEAMNEEDQTVALSVRKELPRIEEAIEAVVRCLQSGGRLVYAGAGSSGRMGLLDAAECPPTFGVEPALVTALLAGGQEAMLRAVEDAEDDADAGKRAVHDTLTNKDVLVGIAASGRTPYVLGAIEAASQLGAVTVGLACNKDTPLGRAADYPIEIALGPEVLAGSTRLKGGTAQKMTLNMISTAAMIRLGKVYGNLMVNVQATNDKLRHRVVRIIREATGADEETAERCSRQANGDAGLAILMIQHQATMEEASQALQETNRHFRQAGVRLANRLRQL